MKITCRLYPIAVISVGSGEIECIEERNFELKGSNTSFLSGQENPFPCSRLLSTAVFLDQVVLCYIQRDSVSEAAAATELLKTLSYYRGQEGKKEC